MPLTRIEAHNFKSFRDLDVSLGSLNVLIGANASGKSNFVQLLSFLRNLESYGLDNALSMQGGSEYLTNLSIKSNTPFHLNVTAPSDSFSIAALLNIASDYHVVSAVATSYSYNLTITPPQDDRRSPSASDHLRIECNFMENLQLDPHIEQFIGNGHVDLFLSDEKLSATVVGPSNIFILDIVYPWDNIRQSLIKRDSLLLNTLSSGTFVSAFEFAKVVSSLAIYDFNTKLPKQTAQITGKIDLEEDGSNLVITLKNILEDEGQRREFSNLLHDVLPFAESVDVQRLADRFLHFRLRESYSGDQYLPASLLSDGTIHVIALIVALYFSDRPLIVIEEPERNIHPSLLARIAALLKDASQHKQIIVTTHNPEIVKHVDLEDLLFVSRDREGFSTIRRPAESADVRVFLENEIGIDELFARNLLGA